MIRLADGITECKRRVNLASTLAIKWGVYLRGKCEICGSERSVAHHDDYNFPLDVRFLCGRCHASWHKNNESIPPRKALLLLNAAELFALGIDQRGLPPVKINTCPRCERKHICNNLPYCAQCYVKLGSNKLPKRTQCFYPIAFNTLAK